ncbi:ubiquitin carboxyl-terminal hydrolase 47 isoform X2 [Glossina fuscipes]|uniref:Ubiquitin carboxyl-terminal hydrolase 47 n=1 Tax=Glossina fuscipes TaxID=7396 RepID=A0A9C5ZJQ3_9MUSC|nr:ubiquitin carboxyl-terminal hydrolase 47 isoform X2 [Glossina fuscipes]
MMKILTILKMQDYPDGNAMVQLDHENSIQCVVHDKTPDSEQRKINIVVRPPYTVGKVIADIKTQYRYDKFDLILQPNSGTDLVYLNDHQPELLYNVPGFEQKEKNYFILFPAGKWDGNVKFRYDIAMGNSAHALPNGSAAPKSLIMFNDHNISINNNGVDISTSTSSSSNIDNNNVNNIASSGVTNGANGSINHSDEDMPVLNSRGMHIPTNDANVSPPSSMTTVTNATNTDSLNLSPMSEPDPLSDDDLALGASASPPETEPMQCGAPLSLAHTSSPNFNLSQYGVYRDLSDTLIEAEKKYRLSSLPSLSPAAAGISSNNGYVGLVNQAMTCYLNSLLQALFMTPEFRNALYRWEFDNDHEAKNIPYQLQKLFLNLQTSKKSAVETTDLTRSFGWNSSEAWQQHDIQELCRVMFDALEHKFKNTKQVNLIANLYEGKMIDYVKCFDCNTEKTRADTFLDIPLPVRPFGSTAAYGSIEEALRAFVQPETLDGNNQYFCEKCNKKCDAHKGLKFKNFPYILTLHLKRFDFDYQTMHRLKLNDKVTFPQVLNLSTFITSGGNESAQTNGSIPNGSSATTDDCSTTDSGSAMEEDNWSSGITTTNSIYNVIDMNDEDQDEGIDMSSSTDHRNRINSSQHAKNGSNQYAYELFAIMIHSGSASGGHYYAYIKEFENSEWYCFNDQSVTPITQDDIQKSFGGGSSKGYYSSVYSSSTNAYMLMYRQIDPKRNEKVLRVDDFPAHIKTLAEKLGHEEELRITRSGGGSASSSNARHRPISDLALPEHIKPRVYFYNPELRKLKMTRVYITQKFDLNSVLESAYQMLSVEQFAPLTHCRLVAYDPAAERIIRSFENTTNTLFNEIRNAGDDPIEFLLEYRADGQEFEIYEPDGATWYVFMVNLSTMEMDGPFFVYSQALENNPILKRSIATRLNVSEEHLLVATTQRHKKAFAACDLLPNTETQQHLQKLARSRFKDITYLFLNVPSTDATNLEIIDIPYDGISARQDQLTPAGDAVPDGSSACTEIYDSRASGDSAQPANFSHNLDNLGGNILTTPALKFAVGHESNSEDSSLSDGDRTLVENLQNRGGGDSQISSTSHSPQLSSPEDENRQDSINRVNAFYSACYELSQSEPVVDPQATQFFHAIKLDVMDTATLLSNRHHNPYSDLDSGEDVARKPMRSYKILVDSHMKLSVLKRHIERLINVPQKYFQIHHKHDKKLLSMSQSLVYFSEGEVLSVELGKELLPEEHRAKIYFMRLSEFNNDTARVAFICEWIYTDATPVIVAKKALIAKLQRIDGVKYKTLTLDNCRLWLKGGRSPIRIYADNETMGSDVLSSASMEFIIQECEDGVSPNIGEDGLVIFVRRWYPDTLELGRFQEIALEKHSEIQNALSKLSGIPEENIAYTKVNGYFPNTNVSLLSINNAMSWISMPATVDKYPLISTVTGNMYFYKDVTTTAKELTNEERREWSAKEKSRLDRLGCISTSRFSPRRERALKIYLDPPAAGTNSTTVMPPPDANTTMIDDLS